jgi:hypothetical protein
MVVREVRFEVTPPGFRTRSVTLVTTLLDANTYPAWALAELWLLATLCGACNRL